MLLKLRKRTPLAVRLNDLMRPILSALSASDSFLLLPLSSNDRMPASSLPIDSVLPELLAALSKSNSVVLKAPAGAGKTTRVPTAVLDAGLAGERQILMLQPRRVAARAAARRMSFERGTKLGEDIGYQVRFDEQVTARTRIRVVTEGVLLRMLFDDPFLERLGVVVFDEFHERSLSSDVALGMVWRIQQTVRPDLKIVVMSATLAAQPIAQFLGGCPIVESEGRTFPVEVRYLKFPDQRPIVQQASEAVVQMLDRTSGDMLVFLPGVGEIRRVEQELSGRLQDVAVMPLYGDLPAEQQDAVLAPCPRRKIVLATNVAETSITVDGITCVIDSGLARVPTFDANVGLDRLELKKCSKASADQRAGRAGRTAPGVCLRLWDERSQVLRPDFEEPEVRRVDLAGTVLQLWCWGEREVAAFPWFEPPRAAAVEQALDLLKRLDAITDVGVTPLGELIARFPTHPRIGRLLLEGQSRGVAERVALLAALLSERDPFMRQSEGGSRPQMQARLRSQSDTLDRLSALEDFAQRGTRQSVLGEINMNSAKFLIRAAEQFVSMLPRGRRGVASQSSSPAHSATVGESSDVAVMRSLLAAYPDRLAKRRGPRERRALMVGGRGVKLAPQSGVEDGDFFLCINVDAGQNEADVREASFVEREWLPVEHLRTDDELFFHPSQKRVAARRRTYWDDLLIEESTAPLPKDARVGEALFAAIAENPSLAFPSDDESVANFILRVRCLAQWRPDYELPTFDDNSLREVLQQLCAGRSSLDEVRKAAWLDYLQAALTPTQQQALNRDAPERIEVPSGSKIRLQYELNRPPVLAVRMQEVFGMLQTPRVAGGRVPVLMHLLAPNMRPEQITEDLKSFWDNVYPTIRKSLRVRYPKHSWPDDPLTATPVARPGKRRVDA